MRELLVELQTGQFISRWAYRNFGFKDTKGLDNALYKLRRKGHDIRKVNEAGETMYYMRQTKKMSDVHEKWKCAACREWFDFYPDRVTKEILRCPFCGLEMKNVTPKKDAPPT